MSNHDSILDLRFAIGSQPRSAWSSIPPFAPRIEDEGEAPFGTPHSALRIQDEDESEGEAPFGTPHSALRIQDEDEDEAPSGTPHSALRTPHYE